VINQILPERFVVFCRRDLWYFAGEICGILPERFVVFCRRDLWYFAGEIHHKSWTEDKEVRLTATLKVDSYPRRNS